jgi:Zn finger protein HypA/HybF involved in hydrogenase expression
MKSQFIVMIAGIALAFSTLAVQAADAPTTKATTAKKSMAEKGSFHTIHKKSQKLDCEDCHEKDGLPDNTLFVRLHEAVPKDSPGPVSSDACHECHGKKQKKEVTWYAPKLPRK